MVRYTNYGGLPIPMYNAISNPSYIKKGDISVTTLIAAPLVNILKSNFDYEEDVLDNVWAMFGSSIHEWIEKATGKHDEKEILESSIKVNLLLDVLKTFHDDKLGPAASHKELMLRDPVYQTLWAKYTEEKTLLLSYKQKDPNWLAEESMLLEVGGLKVSGTSDLVDILAKILYDYKVTSVWKVIKGIKNATSIMDKKFWEDDLVDWKLQTNIYRYMLWKTKGVVIDSIKIIAILKDYSKTEKYRNRDYPAAQVITINIPLLSFEEIELYLSRRVVTHKQAREIFAKDGKVDNVPICTEKERWAKPLEYAVMKTGRASAVKLCSSEAIAKEKILEEAVNGRKVSDYFIEPRPSKNIKCEDYCSVNKLCPFFQKNYLNK